MQTTTSADGTTIAYDRLGEGLAVVLVSGASTTRQTNAVLAGVLAGHFTVYNYDRRGRGDSGDTAPYALEREIEDITAVIGEAGGPAHLWGSSSGAALALHATASGAPVGKLALWEPPYGVTEGAAAEQREYTTRLTELLAADRRGDAMELFMTRVGLPAEMIAGMRQAPFWAGLEELAHTLAYDNAAMGDGLVPTERAARIGVPTLVAAGGASPDFLRAAARAVADAVPGGQYRALDGQTHDVDPAVLGPALVEFFSA